MSGKGGGWRSIKPDGIYPILKGIIAMNKRVAVEIPEAMHRLLRRYADLHGFDTDAYAAQVLHKHLEDVHDIAIVEAHLEEVRNGNSRTYTMEELEKELGLDD
ncbi:hypothetical protein GCM10010924_26500 [Rhizobium wenxiniae]|uniref:RHH-type rel operon transcriptional repressor/antitoxin RelB n=1 Tax=Rhizobium wenxiniae TaxID=1737357 RepID=A0A7X0CZR2_9HYPH|nr:DUF6290 family protein [Rhizobium wenxiniae]MBB6162640.1 RHH-type rel operon transcriptional repressor/antitoxin RelB [Rhizobium wenxiniae]GGF97077.1 hypothetical protein GCM10010924_26500 [Rhizobium wenxiniae]